MIPRIARQSCASTCFVLVAMTCCLPAIAERNAATLKKGERVEAKNGFDWQPGTVVDIRDTGWVTVRLDQVDVPGNIPKEFRERIRTRPFPPDDVRRIKTAKLAKTDAVFPVRKWSDKSGKFSINARFDGTN